MKELENKELIRTMNAMAVAEATKELADELERYVESGQAVKDAEEATKPTFIEKILMKLGLVSLTISWLLIF